MDDERVARGSAAALRVAERLGFEAVRPRLLGHTNNIVLRLDPHPIVAKVGLWAHSPEVLRREHDIAVLLDVEGAPSARPFRRGGWHVDAESGLPVTLWDRLNPAGGGSPGPTPLELAESLRALHAALRVVAARIVLPSYLWAMDLAAEKLADDEAMGMMTPPDLQFLRSIHSSLRSRAAEVASTPDARHALHGEPHAENVVATGAGPRWIDLEAACIGPLEYDLASAGPEIAAGYPELDSGRLELMRLISSANVATWCWAGAQDPSMRGHAEAHLGILRLSQG